MQDEKTVDWLLNDNGAAVRHLTLRWLLNEPEDAPEVRKARNEAHQEPPIARILSVMEPEGYWVKPGSGYSPKYKSTVWALIALAQSGADAREDDRICKAIDYFLDHARFPYSPNDYCADRTDTIDCLVGNMCWSLKQLGCKDPRLDGAYEWMALSQTEAGYPRVVAPKGAKTGPCWSCQINGDKPCTWAAVKTLMAFGQILEDKRSPAVREAVVLGAELLLNSDPTEANWPSGNNKVSEKWFKLAHPLFYSADLLQLTEALISTGFSKDKRMQPLRNWLVSKQLPDGTWPLKHSERDRMWVSYGPTGKANPWITLRALRALRQLES
ncbi:MAG: hypothetical protein WBI14_08195 [Anaerolineaceae bacterium]